MSATRLRRKLALVAGGTLAGLALAELLLRLVAPQPTGVLATVTDPDLISVNQPGTSGEISIPGVYRHTYTHDAEGRRLTTSPGPGPEVLLLGDSFAYGMGVDDDETMASKLGEGLRQRGMPVTITNGAVPGKGPALALRLLQTHGAAWRPEIAIYLFYPNDFVNVYLQTYFTLEGDSLVPRLPYEPWTTRRTAVMSNPLYRVARTHSHLAGLLWQFALDHVGDNPPMSHDLDTLATPVPWSFPEILGPTETVLRGLRDEFATRDVTLLLAYAPTAAEVAQYRREPAASVDQQRFDAIRRHLGLDAVDLTPTIAALPMPIADLYFAETHWQATSHAVAARKLATPVQAALCARDLSLRGCDRAPAAVRRSDATRADAPPAAPSRRTPAD